MSLAHAPTLLLVDDEPDILRTLSQGIARGLPGARVLTATDPQTGLDLLAREGIDVVISDQKMPGMEGVEFLTRARRLAPRAARIMLTAYPEQRLLERDVNEAHVRYFFTKPYRLADVLSVLRAILEERGREAEDALALARAIEASRGQRAPTGPRQVAPPFLGPLVPGETG